MTPTQPLLALLAELYRQCAFISALVTGFLFAFLAVILTNKSTKRIDDWTAIFTIISISLLTVCALGWTFNAASVQAALLTESQTRILSKYQTIHHHLSVLFILGFYLFLLSLGLSGWIRSKMVGIFSSVSALFAGIYAIWLLHYFIN